MMLAETIASNVNWSLIFTIIMALATAGMWWDARNSRGVKIKPNPLRFEEIVPPANVGEIEARHEEINRRLFALDGPEGQINQLWATLRSEDAKIQNDVNEKFQAIQRSLGRIEGRLEEKS